MLLHLPSARRCVVVGGIAVASALCLSAPATPAFAADPAPSASVVSADPLQVLLARLTPEGKAKLVVPPGGLKPEGHELARTFLMPLARNGPLPPETVTLNTTERLEYHKTRAAQLMKHQVELLGGYGLQDVGMPINWLHAPQNDWQWPTHLSRHAYLVSLGYVYRATGDDRYAREVVDWLLDWLKRQPLDAADLLQRPTSRTVAVREATFKDYGDGPWTSLSAHARVDYWTQLFQLLHDAPALDNRTVAMLLNSLLGDHRQVMLDHPRSMNQYQGVASSLVQLGFYYPDFQGTAEAEKVGWERLETHSTGEIYPDGSMAEASPNYGIGMLRRLNGFILQGRARGRSVPPILAERLRAGMRYFALTADPLGRSPRIAKGGGDLHADLAALESALPDPEVAFVASDGKTGTVPPMHAYGFDWAGHFAFRSSWKKDATWLFFDAGPRGTGHHDIAQLGIQLIANGDWLLCDPGYYTYSTDGEPGRMAAYLHSSAAHNVALVDGLNQISRVPKSPITPNAAPGDYAFAAAPVPTAQGVYTLGFGPTGDLKVVHRRTVRFESAHRIVIEDSFEGTGSHELQLHWQLAPSGKPTLGDNYFSVETSHTRMRLEFQSEKSATLRQFVGEKEPLAGWYSSGYGKLEPAPLVRASFPATLPAKITTVITIEPK